MTEERTEYQHGGPRPAVRPDDRRLAPFRDGPRPGAGKPMRNHTLRVGSQYHVVRKEVVIEPWTVTEVSSDGVTLTNADGDTVSLYRVAP